MSTPVPPAPALLSVRHLKIRFRQRRSWPWQRRGWIQAVDDLHLDLRPGETLGIVGESGSGKSTLARALLGLQAPASGSIRLCGREVVGLPEKEWRPLRRDIQMVFQDPLGSLDPRMSVAQIVEEPLRELYPDLSKTERAQRVQDMIARVGLPEDAAGRLPGEFSGGQAQRIGIARALVARPRILVCDEAVSALDVSMRAQIVNLLAGLRREYGLSMIFIGHDLPVVRYLSDRVVVMYLGRVMEQASADELFGAPQHPYTRTLLAASRSAPAQPAAAPAQDAGKKPAARKPQPPASAVPTPTGCVFHGRCPLMEGVCVRQVPQLRRTAVEHYAACHFLAAPASG
ncbi:MAG: ATP-binding cassette domain-containing protein [Nevskia sp.]|nr:ATP-binding cassette domain-containing protein [Nevskia sp.]